jgi:hypothetical protein
LHHGDHTQRLSTNEKEPAPTQDGIEAAATLTVVNYGYPIAQLAALKDTAVPAVYVGGVR